MDSAKTIRIYSIVLILWQLIGVAAFISQYAMSHGMMAGMPADQLALFQSMPAWAWVSYAIAVSSGTAGAIYLAIGKRLATPLLLISLIAVLIQFSYSLIISNAWAGGIKYTGFPLFIIFVTTSAYYLARRWRGKGLLGA